MIELYLFRNKRKKYIYIKKTFVLIKYALVQDLLLGEVLFKFLFNYKFLFIYDLKIIIK